jgi:hypothetical protein
MNYNKTTANIDRHLFVFTVARMHNKMFGNRLAEGITISYKSLSAVVSARRGQLYSSQTDIPKKN